MAFAKKLDFLMSERQLNQKQLAEAIGKSKSAVSQYLSGQAVPRKTVIEKIAEALDCTVEWLLDNEEAVSDNVGVRNVTVAQCAQILGKSQQFVRVGLQQGTAPFGYAVRTKNRYSYHISRKKLMEYVGEAS